MTLTKMDLYGQNSKSIPQKIVIHFIEILLLWLSFWILFQNGGAWVEKHLGINNSVGDIDRRIIIFVFNLIIFIRLAFMMISDTTDTIFCYKHSKKNYENK